MARTTRSKKTQAAPEVNVGKEIFESLRELEKLTSKGYALQLNLLSLTGQSGAKVKRIAEELLLDGRYTFVGSDVHSRLYINAIKEGTISPKLVERNSTKKI